MVCSVNLKSFFCGFSGIVKGWQHQVKLPGSVVEIVVFGETS